MAPSLDPSERKPEVLSLQEGGWTAFLSQRSGWKLALCLLPLHQESTNCLFAQLRGEPLLAAGYPGTAVTPLFLTSLAQTSLASPRIA